jgi:hypothetical protein
MVTEPASQLLRVFSPAADIQEATPERSSAKAMSHAHLARDP